MATFKKENIQSPPTIMKEAPGISPPPLKSCAPDHKFLFRYSPIEAATDPEQIANINDLGKQ